MYEAQVTMEEFFQKINQLYPTESARCIAELRADKAEAFIRENASAPQADLQAVEDGSEEK